MEQKLLEDILTDIQGGVVVDGNLVQFSDEMRVSILAGRAGNFRPLDGVRSIRMEDGYVVIESGQHSHFYPYSGLVAIQVEKASHNSTAGFAR